MRAEGNRPPGEPEPKKRGVFLRSLRFVYTNYLGVHASPARAGTDGRRGPDPSIILFLVGRVWLLLFVWETIGKASGGR